MKRSFILFIFYLVIRFTSSAFSIYNHSALNVFKIEYEDDFILQFDLPVGSIKSLQAYNSDYSLVINYPSREETPENLLCDITDDEINSTCFISISKNFNNRDGYWKASILTNNNETMTLEFNLYVFQFVKIPGTEKVYIREGKSITVIVRNPKSLGSRSCKLIKKNTTEIYYGMELFPYFVAPNKKKIYSMRRTGGCGVCMTVESSQAGEWVIQESVGNLELRREFEIIVNEKTYQTGIKLEKGIAKWYEGSSVRVDLDTSIYPSYCELQRPDGYIIHSKKSDCVFKIDSVTKADIGVWTLHFSTIHALVMHQKKISIEVDDIPEVGIDVECTKKCNSVLVSIESEFWFDVQNCKIKNPNGIIMPISENYQSCYFRIEKLSNEYLGEWEMSMYDGGNIINVLMNINETDISWKEERVWISLHREKYVKQGNAFTVKCSTHAKLDYCWIRSPKGTLYSLEKDNNSEHFERNLQKCSMTSKKCGCTVLLKNAMEDYNGNWTCQMGLKNDQGQLNSTIPIIITDSDLITKVEVIDYPNGRNTAIFQCRLRIELYYNHIEKCLWLGPREDYIFHQNSSEISIVGGVNDCDFQLNGLEEKDFGIWTCHISLANSTEQHSSTVELRQESMSNTIGKPSSIAESVTEDIQFISKVLLSNNNIDTAKKLQQETNSNKIEAIPTLVLTNNETIQVIPEILESNRINSTKEIVLQCRSDVKQPTKKVKTCWWSDPKNNRIPLSNTSRYTFWKIDDYCSIRFNDLEISDVGYWTCHFLLSNSYERHQSTFELRQGLKSNEIEVFPLFSLSATGTVQLISKVLESDRINIVKEIVLPSRSDTEQHSKILKSCWWIHPRQSLIPNINSSKYTFLKTDDYCNLKINDLKIDDIGNWTCNFLSPNDGEIHSSIFELRQESKSNTFEVFPFFISSVKNSSMTTNLPSCIESEHENRRLQDPYKIFRTISGIISFCLISVTVSIIAYVFMRRRRIISRIERFE